ncbi:hypothetical protein FH972_012799 [Carpinus fangiana]|uniref:Uncharacterized protein n=1 Tax=Carpinus fangiana TaxID=176857 RepID=A0A5N6R538_9ROSI|nr:hypothetical protein FH972_012799 [Carpinus fangiana]
MGSSVVRKKLHERAGQVEQTRRLHKRHMEERVDLSRRVLATDRKIRSGTALVSLKLADDGNEGDPEAASEAKSREIAEAKQLGTVGVGGVGVGVRANLDKDPIGLLDDVLVDGIAVGGAEVTDASDFAKDHDGDKATKDGDLYVVEGLVAACHAATPCAPCRSGCLRMRQQNAPPKVPIVGRRRQPRL